MNDKKKAVESLSLTKADFSRQALDLGIWDALMDAAARAGKGIPPKVIITINFIVTRTD